MKKKKEKTKSTATNVQKLQLFSIYTTNMKIGGGFNNHLSCINNYNFFKQALYA